MINKSTTSNRSFQTCIICSAAAEKISTKDITCISVYGTPEYAQRHGVYKLQEEVWTNYQYRIMFFKNISNINVKIFILDDAFRYVYNDCNISKLILIQVMAWCLTAPSHHLNLYWSRSLMPHCIPRRQWVNSLYQWEFCIKILPTLMANLWGKI